MQEQIHPYVKLDIIVLSEIKEVSSLLVVAMSLNHFY